MSEEYVLITVAKQNFTWEGRVLSRGLPYLPVRVSLPMRLKTKTQVQVGDVCLVDMNDADNGVGTADIQEVIENKEVRKLRHKKIIPEEEEYDYLLVSDKKLGYTGGAFPYKAKFSGGGASTMPEDPDVIARAKTEAKAARRAARRAANEISPASTPSCSPAVPPEHTPTGTKAVPEMTLDVAGDSPAGDATANVAGCSTNQGGASSPPTNANTSNTSDGITNASTATAGTNESAVPSPMAPLPTTTTMTAASTAPTSSGGSGNGDAAAQVDSSSSDEDEEKEMKEEGKTEEKKEKADDEIDLENVVNPNHAKWTSSDGGVSKGYVSKRERRDLEMEKRLKKRSEPAPRQSPSLIPQIAALDRVGGDAELADI